MSPTESTDTDITSCQLSYPDIKVKILNGEFKVKIHKGRSRLWNLFAKIENKSGEELPDLVTCRSCYTIYKYNKNSMSNLSKHKCFIALKSMADAVPVKPDSDKRENLANSIAEWVIENCRSYEVIEDSGFKNVVDAILSIGDKFGRNVELNSFLPNATSISRSINKAYNTNFEKIKMELRPLKTNGFGLTADAYKDNYLKKLYIAVAIHYINNGKLTSRVLGFKPIEGITKMLK